MPTLHEQLTLTSSDASAARVLASGADHDVFEVRVELRAHTQALNALREVQLEQGKEMRERFAEQDQRMCEGFATLATGMAQITALLTNHSGPAGLDESP